MPDPSAPADRNLTADERAAIRAYLQRSEVRLSTVHRVGSALLSGAGLMVLLPAVERDSLELVLRTLLTGPTDAAHLLLVVAVAASLAVPLTALWLLLRDLTQFYFHANHLRHDTGEAFTPRFTLTGLRLPSDELGPAARAGLDTARTDTEIVRLLVPPNDAARERIDRQLGAYGLDRSGPGIASDQDRAAAQFELAAATSRPLVDEVAKVEHGMARHVLSIQVIVLRYAKALLALLTSALAAFAAAGVVSAPSVLDPGQETWLAGIFLIWAPVAIVAVTSPVRWLDRQLRSEGATHLAAAHDPELTRVETVTVRLALGGFAAAAAAMLAVSLAGGQTTPTRIGAGAVLVTACMCLAVALRSLGSLSASAANASQRVEVS